MNFSGLYIAWDDDFNLFFYPRPAFSVKRKAPTSLPWREGLREGDKVAFPFKVNINLKKSNNRYSILRLFRAIAILPVIQDSGLYMG